MKYILSFFIVLVLLVQNVVTTTKFPGDDHGDVNIGGINVEDDGSVKPKISKAQEAMFALTFNFVQCFGRELRQYQQEEQQEETMSDDDDADVNNIDEEEGEEYNEDIEEEEEEIFTEDDIFIMETALWQFLNENMGNIKNINLEKGAETIYLAAKLSSYKPSDDTLEDIPKSFISGVQYVEIDDEDQKKANIVFSCIITCAGGGKSVSSNEDMEKKQ